MSLSSSLQDFSLAELFKMIDQGQKSGLLTVCILPESRASELKSERHYVWFRQGRMMAAANRLDGEHLANKIMERGWLSQSAIVKLNRKASTQTPLGLQLKTAGLLQAEQINLLFASQMYQVRNLFEAEKGVFELNEQFPVPVNEMTGLSLGAIEVAMTAVRDLKNWHTLANALPHPSSGIKSIVDKQMQVRLNAFEWQVWEFAQGTVSLEDIAQQLHQPTIKVQQAAFRLMLATLVEEVALVKQIKAEKMNFSSFYPVGEESGVKKNMSFLENLVGFLRGKF